MFHPGFLYGMVASFRKSFDGGESWAEEMVDESHIPTVFIHCFCPNPGHLKSRPPLFLCWIFHRLGWNEAPIGTTIETA